MSKRCTACGQIFQPSPRIRNQTFCSNPECQLERRRRWQQKKRREDIDYRANDSDYRKTWAPENPNYWKRYRQTNPNYAERNRIQQQNRNQRQRERAIAKVDASSQVFSFPSGRYRLVPVGPDGIAKGDAIIVEITVLSVSCDVFDP